MQISSQVVQISKTIIPPRQTHQMEYIIQLVSIVGDYVIQMFSDYWHIMPGEKDSVNTDNTLEDKDKILTQKKYNESIAQQEDPLLEDKDKILTQNKSNESTAQEKDPLLDIDPQEVIDKANKLSDQELSDDKLSDDLFSDDSISEPYNVTPPPLPVPPVPLGIQYSIWKKLFPHSYD